MENSGFFDAKLVDEVYDRTYLAADFAAYFASFIGTGVFQEHANALQVTANSTANMSVNVLSGQGWINGYWYENTDTLNLTIGTADGVLNRIDSVVLRLGFSERQMWLTVVQGTAASSPIAPDVVRTADYYDLKLAEVYVAAGAITITQSAITDTRADSDVCGWVVGVVQQIDTSPIFTQFNAYYEEFKENAESDYSAWSETYQSTWSAWMSTQQSAFNTWFENVKNQLSTDVAGQLQVEIDELDSRTTNLEQMVIQGEAFAAAEVSTGELLATDDNYVIVFKWDICECEDV